MGEKRSTLAPPKYPAEAAACEPRLRAGWGAALKKAALSPGGSGPRPQSPTPQPRGSAGSTDPTPTLGPGSPDRTHRPRGSTPVGNALNFGSRPQTRATRSPAPWAALARLGLCGGHLGPVPSESGSHARRPTLAGPGRQHTPPAALTSGFSAPRSHSHPEPRRPSEHLEEGGTPGTWQL